MSEFKFGRMMSCLNYLLEVDYQLVLKIYCCPILEQIPGESTDDYLSRLYLYFCNFIYKKIVNNYMKMKKELRENFIIIETARYTKENINTNPKVIQFIADWRLKRYKSSESLQKQLELNGITPENWELIKAYLGSAATKFNIYKL